MGVITTANIMMDAVVTASNAPPITRKTGFLSPETKLGSPTIIFPAATEMVYASGSANEEIGKPSRSPTLAANEKRRNGTDPARTIPDVKENRRNTVIMVANSS